MSVSFYPQMKDGQHAPHSVGKIICIGRNYAAHAAELNNPVPSEPLVFIKPSTSACQLDPTLSLRFDLGTLHYETELALLINKPLSQATEEDALQAIGAMGLALDLTLRSKQSSLKEKGHPWEVAKGFDRACPLTSFISVEDPENRFAAGNSVQFSLTINDEIRQRGNTANMLFPIAKILSYMSHYFTLEPGDIVLTGTPEGVGELVQGQHLTLALDDQILSKTLLA